MRKFVFLVVCALSLLMSSCVITEEVIFNADKSGKINYRFDMSKVMEMAGGSMGESTSKNKKNIDSTFTFKELFADKKDSIAKLSPEQQERIKAMEKFSIHMVMDESKKQFIYEMYGDFESPAELQEVFSPVNSMSSLNPMGEEAKLDGFPKNDGVTKYTYTGKTFKKVVRLQTKDEVKKQYQEELEMEGVDEVEADEFSSGFADSMEMMLTESSYNMIVRFPKKVKKVSVSNAVISEDGKTVTISYPLENYMKSLDMDFEVELAE